MSGTRQKRGEERRAKILNAAYEIISEMGVDGLTMSEIGKRSKTPHGSLYQYYPGKRDVILALATHKFEKLRGTYAEHFRRCRSLEDFLYAARECGQSFVDAMVAEPALLLLWNGIRADKSLSKFDIEDTRQNVELVSDALAPFALHKSDDEIDNFALMLVEFTATIARMGSSIPPCRQQNIFDMFCDMTEKFIRNT